MAPKVTQPNPVVFWVGGEQEFLKSLLQVTICASRIGSHCSRGQANASHRPWWRLLHIHPSHHFVSAPVMFFGKKRCCPVQVSELPFITYTDLIGFSVPSAPHVLPSLRCCGQRPVSMARALTRA